MTEEWLKATASLKDNGLIADDVSKEMISYVQRGKRILTDEAQIVKVNERSGFVYTMIPLLIVLASYISAMLISQHLQLA